ncbi:MAG: hypothetical protein IK094_00160 [Treponema sp.]|nr:hypothetical protein [Treponema sp.]
MGTEEVGVKSENIKIDIECPIKELGLHWKVNKVLWRANIMTIKKLVSMTEKQAKDIKGCGSKTFLEIKKKLDEFGLSFRVEILKEKVSLKNKDSKLKQIRNNKQKNEFSLYKRDYKKAEDIIYEVFLKENDPTRLVEVSSFYDSVDEKYITKISNFEEKIIVPFPRSENK